ncbi:MAG: radical SAM protein [Myxococcaceae bacterium]|nr:radical SAM protein [Myxococcaceae bacterium]
MRGRVFDLQRCCVNDGPGLRTTVFLAGCPLRCAWCHNPEAFAGDTARWVEAEEVLDEVLADRDFFEATGGGLTVSGGEPLLQPAFVKEVLTRARAEGLHTCVQTSGAVPRDALLAIVGLADLVQFDLKHPDALTHERLTGRRNDDVLANAAFVAAHAKQVEFRVPVVPGFTDDGLEGTAAFVRGLGAHALHLLPYQRTYLDKYRRLGLGARCATVEPAAPSRLASLASRVEAAGVHAVLVC